ncbi:MAG: leucine-rich repeat domain-containing protein, partial [Bacteroidaceae bacterium]|nr:leucine-rich repeat domain-containing protein [Bacteroidaceae bacterium]
RTSNGVHYLVNYIGQNSDIILPNAYNGFSYKIDEYAFYGCSSLTTITLPEGVTSIGNRAFEYCSSLTAITIPEGVTSIGSGAFEYCSSLTTINIPEGVTCIGGEAFAYCSSITSVTIPENSLLTNIGVWAFYECSSLTSITIPESVASIGFRAFNGCSGELIVNCNIPSSYSEYGAFSGSEFTKVTIGDKVTIIGDYAFEYCRSLTSITIPEGVTSIGNRVFYNCSSLTTITIPASVTSIGKETFANCENMQDVYCYAVSVPATDRSAFNDSYPDYATLHVPASALVSYISAAPWKSFGKIVVLSEATPDKTSVTITIGEYGCGTYSSEYALDFSEVEGLKAYAATGYNKRTGVVTLVRVMTTQPCMGIFLKGEPGKEYEVPVIEESDDNTINLLVATLTQTPVNQYSADGLYVNYKYTIKENEPMFYPFADGSSLSAGKAYLQIPTAWLPAAEQKSISIRFDEGEGTTDMEDIDSTVNSQQSTDIYDLQGRRVEKVEKGIYIINGKKVVIK